MQQVVIWAALLGIGAFALGLVSAIGARRLRKQADTIRHQASLHHRTVIVQKEQVSDRNVEEPRN